MRKPKPWWHDNITLIVVHGLIKAAREFFCAHVCLAPLAPLKKPTKPCLLYEQVEELERERSTADAFERCFELSEKLKNANVEQHRQWLKKHGLLEDAPHNDVMEYCERCKRETADNRAALDAEQRALERLRDEAEGDAEKEVALLREYSAEHPGSNLGSSCLVGALRRTRQFNEAIRVARQQIELATRKESLETSASQKSVQNYSLHILLMKQRVGEMLLEIGDTQEGIRQLERTIAEQERDADDTLRNVFLSYAYLRLGDAYRKHGTISEARNAWKEALYLRQQDREVNVMNNIYIVTGFSDYGNAMDIIKRLKETAELS